MCFYFILFFFLKAKMKIKMRFQTNKTKPSGYLKWFSIHHKILKFGLKYRNVESWQVFFDFLFFLTVIICGDVYLAQFIGIVASIRWWA